MVDGIHPYALVVDDDPMVRMTAANILEDAGFRAFTAQDGDEAMRLLVENHASVVLLFTDVQMPGGKDGFALARETSQRWPHIAIVVASGVVTPGPGDMPDRARFIGKPILVDVIRAHLQEILPDGQKPEPLRKG